MKPKNFPARVLKRKLVADGKDINTEDAKRKLEEARQIRTKKNRGSK